MSERNRADLAVAKDLIDIFRRLFADLMLSFQDRDTSLLILKHKHFRVVFRVIENELGLTYDLLYTKAMAIHNWLGFTLRIVSILSTGVVLALFSLSDKDKYSKVNTHVTFLLLWIAIFLESHALFVLLFSDKAACWLKNLWPALLDCVERFQPLYNRRRWSGLMGQHNLISLALKEKHPVVHGILESLRVDEKVLKFLFKGDVKLSDFIKQEVMQHFKSISEKEAPSEWTFREDLILQRHGILDKLKWSIELEFDQSILVWHFATQFLCLRKYEEEDDENVGETIPNFSKMSKHLSRYMLYLLVMHPSLLPIGVARVRFRDMYAEAMSFFNEQKLIVKPRSARESEANIVRACEVLCNNVNTQLAPTMSKGDKSKFALYHGCLLASQLDALFEDRPKKWDILSLVWVEMLAYTAAKCKGFQHARQLRQGGEFLTHIWLLMAHFGLTDHFQIPHVPAIAELLVEQE